MDVISWDEFFMGTALLAARRSKDPNTKVGCCIVQDKKIVGVGYNGMPYGCDDKVFPWGREGDPLNTKYLYVVHAELNAILNSTKNLTGATLYATLFPCNECCKAIIQSGIRELVYLSDKYATTDGIVASKRMLRAAGIVSRQLKTDRDELTLSYDETKI